MPPWIQNPMHRASPKPPTTCAVTLELPLLLECAGHCPPEDVGGPIGYANFLTAYYDPSHPDHADVRQWHPQPINPTDPRMPELDAALEKLQKAWAKKRPAKRTSPMVKG